MFYTMIYLKYSVCAHGVLCHCDIFLKLKAMFVFIPLATTCTKIVLKFHILHQDVPK